MSILFKPTGTLNITTDASSLGDGDMTRCKNLVLDKTGQAITRAGSNSINSSSIGSINHIQEQNGTRFSFAAGTVYSDESSIETGLTDAQFSSIKYNAFNDSTQQVFFLNGTERKRIESGVVYDWGIDAGSDTPEAFATDGVNGLTGTYSFRYTLIRKSGTSIVFESTASSASNSVTISSQGISGSLTRPNQVDVTQVRVYRSTDSGTSYFLDDEYDVPYNSLGDTEAAYTYDWENSESYTANLIKLTTTDSTNQREYLHEWEGDFSDGATVTYVSFMRNCFIWEGVRYSSTLSDAFLGAEYPTNHDRPPAGTYVLGPNYNGTCFIIKDNNLYYCLPKQPEYWPADYFIEVGIKQDPGIVMVFHNGQPYYLSKREIYYIQGTGHPVFQPLNMRAKYGAQGVYGAWSVAGQGIYHVGADGLYLFSGAGSDDKITQNYLNDLFTGTASVNGMPAATELTTAWVIVFRNKLYFGYTSDGRSYPTNVITVRLQEPRRITYYEYSFQIRSVEIDETNDRLLAGCTDGIVRELETGTTDDGSEIPWEIQPKDYTLQTRKHFPRWVKYDIDASGSSSVTGQYLLNDTVLQTHTITGTRVTRRRLVTGGNGERATVRITGSGVGTIYGVEAE